MSSNTKMGPELFCVPVADMRIVLDAWKVLVEKFNLKQLGPTEIKMMDDALANIVQFTKRPKIKFTNKK